MIHITNRLIFQNEFTQSRVKYSKCNLNNHNPKNLKVNEKCIVQAKIFGGKVIVRNNKWKESRLKMLNHKMKLLSTNANNST